MPGKKPLCLLLLSLLLATSPLTAQPLRLAASQGVSLEQAVAQVKKQTGGRILSAETYKLQGQRIHRIKVLLPDGRIRVVKIKAGS